MKPFKHRIIRRCFTGDFDSSVTYSKFIQQLSTVRIPQNYKRDLFSKVMTSESAQTTQMSDVRVAKELSKSPDFSPARTDYEATFRKDPFGAVETFEWKGRQLCVVGACYTHIPPQNIWKILKLFEPDAVMLHLAPDDHLQDFALNLKNPKSGAFSNRLYYRQLEMQPGSFHWDSQAELLAADRITAEFLTDLSELLSSTDRPVKPSQKCVNKLTDELVATVALYSRKHRKPVILGDLPDIVAREKVVNALTVSEMRQVLKATTLKAVTNPDFVPNTPLYLAHLDYPELFLGPSEHYTASLLEYIIKRHPYQNILVFAGNNQAASLRAVLERRTVLPIVETLIAEMPKGSFYSAPLVEEMAEKLALFDVMRLGGRILSEKITVFPNSKSLIRKYSPEDVYSQQKDHFQYLHTVMIRRYLSNYFEYLEDGLKGLQRHFYEKALQKTKQLDLQ